MSNVNVATASESTSAYVVGTNKDTDIAILRNLVRTYTMLGIARMLTHINGIGQGRIQEGTSRATVAKAEKKIKDALRSVIQEGEFRYVRSSGQSNESGEMQAVQPNA